MARTIVIWGCGWSAGVLLALFATGLTPSLWSYAGTTLAVAVVAFGVPTYYAAKAVGSPHPRLEAFVWAVGILVAASWFTIESGAALGASPGDLNENTTATMQERTRRAGRGGLPVELVAAVQCVATSMLVAGSLSALCTTSGRLRGPLAAVKIVLFGGVTAGAVLAGILVVPVAASILGQLVSIGVRSSVHELLAVLVGIGSGGFVAGCVVGGAIEPVRLLVARERPN